MSLKIKNLSVSLGKISILRDINLIIKSGEIHVLMGPNGSGKSTLAQALIGYKNYKLNNENYELKIDGKNINKLQTDERAREGLFLAFQNPVSVTGVSVADLLRSACQYNDKFKKFSIWEFNKQILKKAQILGIPQDFLKRDVNESFSGGEKKKLEMLQALMLKPKYAIFDEVDTGLDMDALKKIAESIIYLKNQGTGILLITHYSLLLKLVKPKFVHILLKGRIIKSDGYKLAMEVEKKGYANF